MVMAAGLQEVTRTSGAGQGTAVAASDKMKPWKRVMVPRSWMQLSPNSKPLTQRKTCSKLGISCGHHEASGTAWLSTGRGTWRELDVQEESEEDRKFGKKIPEVMESCLHLEESRLLISSHSGESSSSFHPSALQQEENFTSNSSAHSDPDQLTMKDSRRGDSEFNDSHSVFSGRRLKKTPSGMMENQVLYPLQRKTLMRTERFLFLTAENKENTSSAL
ncbi:uncharacterized protein LOC116439823 [Corvus moneduloides]|uniref:uncharacterized protein LOC116439823 n=1 Tax=Corvus moneduloides TaxID=1196302 RepID=UPI0013629318|nr:uncharacterized protein LOC116439823 [Corvus moneduloides]